MRKKIALVLALCLAAAAPALPAAADGSLRTMQQGTLSADGQFSVCDYTGEVRITFLGDCTLGGEERFEKSRNGFVTRINENGMAFPFQELVRLTGGDDLTVANLEGVLSDSKKLTKASKKFNFKGTTAYTEILTLGSVECVTLANNHSHDYGEKGYADTKAALEEAGICWFSENIPAVWENDAGLRIGLIGVKGSLSGSRTKAYEKQAKELREYGCAAIITVMHTGEEYSYEPPDSYQKQVTTRAAPYSDLIIGHHPHVVQGVTVVQGVPVVYSLGNCVFGGNDRPKDFDALVVQAVMHFREGELEKTDLHFYPITVSGETRRNNYSPRFLTGTDAERVLQKMAKSTGTDPGAWDETEGATLTFEKTGK